MAARMDQVADEEARSERAVVACSGATQPSTHLILFSHFLSSENFKGSIQGLRESVALWFRELNTNKIVILLCLFAFKQTDESETIHA